MNETPISCPHCTQLLARTPQLAGQQATCPACQKVFTMPLASLPPNGEKPLPARYANMRRERSPKTRWVILYLVVIVGGTLFCAFGELALQFLLH
jgi:phage FluMu protein Com